MNIKCSLKLHNDDAATGLGKTDDVFTLLFLAVMCNTCQVEPSTGNDLSARHWRWCCCGVALYSTLCERKGICGNCVVIAPLYTTTRNNSSTIDSNLEQHDQSLTRLRMHVLPLSYEARPPTQPREVQTCLLIPSSTARSDRYSCCQHQHNWLTLPQLSLHNTTMTLNVSPF